MIQNIISFNETEAHDIMTHRTNVVAFDQEVLLKNMIDTMLEEGNSRYPVYEENIDKVLQEMKDAGLDTYVAEYQRQFSEYYASVHAE